MVLDQRLLGNFLQVSKEVSKEVNSESGSGEDNPEVQFV